MPCAISEARHPKAAVAQTAWVRSTVTRRPKRRPEDIEAAIEAILSESLRPLSAYQVNAATFERGEPITPMQIYRTFERLIEAGRVRRIETLAAYVITNRSIDAFAICRTCGRVLGMSLGIVMDEIADQCDRLGFSANRYVIETTGICANCSQEQATPAHV